MFSTNESINFNNDVISHAERCIYTHIEKLNDPHHKVLTAAIGITYRVLLHQHSLLHLNYQSYLDVIFSALFTCLTHAKLSIRQLSNDQLNVLATYVSSRFDYSSIITTN